MRTTIIAAMLLMATVTHAQKQDSLVVQITMDSTTFKNIAQLIQENIPPNSTTNKLVLAQILNPLWNNIKLVPREKMVADKPKGKQ